MVKISLTPEVCEVEILLISTVVFFTFRDPEYTFSEDVVTGVVYVDKFGETNKDFTVRVSGGK